MPPARRRPERYARRAYHVRGSDGAERTLYYFSTDLSNAGVKASGFLKFCETLAPGDSLIKSASYLLHSGNFTTVRDFLLANSATIIQDDFGIPLRDYSPKKWRFFPFGRYLGPIDEFPGRYQQRYAELFRRAQPIDFGIGYRWRTMNRTCCCRSGCRRGTAPEATRPPIRRRRRRRRDRVEAAPAAAAGPRALFLVRALERANFTSGRSGSAR